MVVSLGLSLNRTGVVCVCPVRSAGSCTEGCVIENHRARGDELRRPRLTGLRVAAVIAAAAVAFVLLRVDVPSIELRWGGDELRSMSQLYIPWPVDELTIEFELIVSTPAQLIEVPDIEGLELVDAWVSSSRSPDLTQLGDPGPSLSKNGDGLGLLEGSQWLRVRWRIDDCTAFVDGPSVISRPLRFGVALPDSDEVETQVVADIFVPGFGSFAAAECPAPG